MLPSWIIFLIENGYSEQIFGFNKRIFLPFEWKRMKKYNDFQFHDLTSKYGKTGCENLFKSYDIAWQKSMAENRVRTLRKSSIESAAILGTIFGYKIQPKLHS